jgi:hypothetical protein
MQETGSNSIYAVGPPPKVENNPDFVVIVTSQQYEQQKAIDQKNINENAILYLRG